MAAAICGVPAGITERQIRSFQRVHADVGDDVCAALDAADPQF
ncbi:hypothetical protein [Pseudotabrizicola sp. 4114]